MRGFIHGTGVIFKERGIRGFFQGFVPTTARQAANSATRFGSYTTLRQLAEGYVAPGEKLGTLSTFAIGGMAGLITVYVLKFDFGISRCLQVLICIATDTLHSHSIL